LRREAFLKAWARPIGIGAMLKTSGAQIALIFCNHRNGRNKAPKGETMDKAEKSKQSNVHSDGAKESGNFKASNKSAMKDALDTIKRGEANKTTH
jgi:hypothetical protein